MPLGPDRGWTVTGAGGERDRSVQSHDKVGAKRRRERAGARAGFPGVPTISSSEESQQSTPSEGVAAAGRESGWFSAEAGSRTGAEPRSTSSRGVVISRQRRLSESGQGRGRSVSQQQRGVPTINPAKVRRRPGESGLFSAEAGSRTGADHRSTSSRGVVISRQRRLSGSGQGRGRSVSQQQRGVPTISIGR